MELEIHDCSILPVFCDMFDSHITVKATKELVRIASCDKHSLIEMSFANGKCFEVIEPGESRFSSEIIQRYYVRELEGTVKLKCTETEATLTGRFPIPIRSKPIGVKRYVMLGVKVDAMPVVPFPLPTTFGEAVWSAKIDLSKINLISWNPAETNMIKIRKGVVRYKTAVSDEIVGTASKNIDFSTYLDYKEVSCLKECRERGGKSNFDIYGYNNGILISFDGNGVSGRVFKVMDI